jgi:hypothetical protein
LKNEGWEFDDYGPIIYLADLKIISKNTFVDLFRGSLDTGRKKNICLNLVFEDCYWAPSWVIIAENGVLSKELA